MRAVKVVLLASAALHGAATLAADAPFPTRPIRVVIPSAPGGGSDAVARMLAQKSGVPGYEAASWYMIIMPAKTPPALIARMHDQTVQALKSPDIVDVLAKGGSEPVGNSSVEAKQFLKTDIARWSEVITQAMVTVQ